MGHKASTQRQGTAKPVRRRMGARLALISALALLGALALAPAAQAEFEFCPVGSGAGECIEPGGVATDFETERLYVADEDNHRIDVFAEDGEFLFAFGYGVDTGAVTLEKCTTASACQKGISGSAAGQLSSPRWIAVDNEAGSPNLHHVYVTDRDFRINHFDSEGNFVDAWGWGVDAEEPKEEAQVCDEATGCLKGVSGSGACQISGVLPISVGPGGSVFVVVTTGGEPKFTSKVEEFGPEGECLGETPLWEEENLRAKTLAVDSEGDAYVSVERAGGEIRKYDPETAEELCRPDEGINAEALALGEEDHLFAFQREEKASGGSFFEVITEYEPNCDQVRRFGYDQIDAIVRDVAALHTPTGDVFASEPTGILHVPSGGPGPITVQQSMEPLSVANARATIYAELNPEGKPTEVHAEYLTQAAYEEQGESFEGPATKSTEPVPLEVPEGREFRVNATEVLLGCPEATKELIEEEICLTPETEYRYRLIATNEDNPTGEGEGTVEGAPFTTKEPLEVQEAFSTGVGTDTATLHALLNPFGIPASGYFEYLTNSEYEANLQAERDPFAGARRSPDPLAEPPQAELDFGSAETGTERTAALYPLQPGTTYRYRLIATNALIDGTLQSEVGSFSTFASPAAGSCPNSALRDGASALLPDCRAYEMVSPTDKQGGDIVGAEVGDAPLNQSASSGQKLAYGTYRAFGEIEGAPLVAHYIAARDNEQGWQSHGISPPHGTAISTSVSFQNEFRAFSEDLCEGWLVPTHDPTLAPGAVPGIFNLYRRADQLCGPRGYEALTTLAPEAIEFEAGNPFSADYLMEVHGIAEGAEAFVINDSLEGTGAPPQPESCLGGGTCRSKLYLKAPGEDPLYACVRPDGRPSEGDCGAGGGVPFAISLGPRANLTGALSEDATSLYWTSGISGVIGEGRIYLRRNPLAEESARRLGVASGTGDLVGPGFAFGKFNSFQAQINAAEGAFAVGQEVIGEQFATETTIVALEETSEGVFKLTLDKKPLDTALSGAFFEVGGVAAVSNVATESGEFVAGQQISGPGIPPGTTIEATGAGTLTLSAKATETAIEAPLSATSPCSEAAKACTVDVSAAAEAAEGTANALFWAAAPDGSRAIFTTGNLGNQAAALYEYDAAGEAAHKIAGEVVGVMGSSEDLSRVYFASEEVLTGEEANDHGDVARAKERNLYLYERSGPGEGSLRFVATLVAGEGAAPSTAISSQPLGHNGRVSPSGAHAAFVSAAPLTGYDNTDAVSGLPDREVFVFDAEAGELRCASCNPSGARPVGAVRSGTNGVLYGEAARIPAWSTNLYAPKVLAEDGSRLYFESLEALSPRDTNGKIDVYQWERPGTGGCKESSATYAPRAGGCIDLISSGKGGRDAELIDASADGDDVFFSTLSSLVAKDTGLVDIYDARVGGGFPAPQPAAAECEGEACQSAEGAPEDPTPASAAYRGAGNLAQGATSGAERCRAAARKAKRASRRAKRARRAARAAKAPAKRRRLARAARRRAKSARRLSGNAKRCRARARQARRAGR